MPCGDLERIAPSLQRAQPQLGEVVYEARGTIERVHFQTSAIVSLLYVLDDGVAPAEDR